jgi:hypothetical protein
MIVESRSPAAENEVVDRYLILDFSKAKKRHGDDYSYYTQWIRKTEARLKQLDKDCRLLSCGSVTVWMFILHAKCDGPTYNKLMTLLKVDEIKIESEKTEASDIHAESYNVLTKMLERAGINDFGHR